MIFVSGCLDLSKLSGEQKSLCNALSTNTATLIPECRSEDECMKKAKEAIQIDSSEFSEQVKKKISLFEKKIASSWVQLNKSRKILNEINSICSQKNTSGLSLKLNELINYLDLSVKEINESNKIALDLIESEKKELEFNEIQLIKEEKLFNDYINLISNLNDLGAENHNSNSFASNYLKDLMELNQLSSGIGVNSSKSSFLQIDFFNTLANFDSIVKENLGFNLNFGLLQFPLIKDYLFTSIKNSLFSSNYSVANEALKKMNPQKIFSVFDSMIGKENSNLLIFSKMLNENALHRKELREKKEMLAKEIELKANEVSLKINSFDSEKFKAIDEKFFEELIISSKKETEIKSRSINLSELNEFDSIVKEFLGLKKEFNELITSSEFQKIGFALSSLREKENRFQEINERIEFLDNDLTGYVIDLCNAKTSLVSDTLNSINLPKEFIEVIYLKNKAKNKLSDYSKADNSEKISLCRSISDEFNEFKKALENFNQYKLGFESEIESCIEDAKKIVLSESRFNSFKERLNLLLSLSKPYENSIQLIESCSQFKSELLNFLPEAGKINEKFFKAVNYLKKIEFLDADESGKFEKEFIELSSFFKDNNLLPEKFRELNEIAIKVNSFFERIRLKLIELTEKNLSEETQVVFFSFNAPIAGESSENELKIVIENPFFDELNEELFFEIELNGKEIELIKKSLNVSEVKLDGNKLRIQLNSLPAEQQSIELKLISRNSSVKEKNSVKSMNLNEALIQREIEINSDYFIPVLEVKTVLYENFSLVKGITAFDSGKAINFTLNENEVSFFLEDVKSGRKAFMEFFVDDSLELIRNEIQLNELNENVSEISQEFTLKNNLELDAEKIIVPISFGLNLGSLQEIKFFSLKGEKIEVKNVFEDAVLIEINKLEKNSSIEFNAFLKINNLKKNFNESLLEAKNDLIELSDSAGAGIKATASEILNELKLLENLNEVKDKDIIKLQEIESETQELKEEKQKNELALIEFEALLQELNELINEKELQLIALQEEGKIEEFFNEKNKLGGQKISLNEIKEMKELNAFEALTQLNELRNEFTAPVQENLFSFFEKKNNLMNDFSELKEANPLFFEANPEKVNEILSLNNEIEKLISKNDSINSGEKLSFLEKKISDLNEATEKMKVKELNDLSVNAVRFIELIHGNELKKEIDSFEEILSGVNESELREMQYIPPLSSSELKKKKDFLSELKTKFSKSKLEAFIDLIEKNEIDKAIEFKNKNLKGFEDAFNEAALIEKELNEKKQGIEKDSFEMLQNVLEFAEGNSNESALSALSNAKKSFEESNYLDSIKQSFIAKSLIKSDDDKLPEIPLILLPIIGLLIISGFFLYKRNMFKFNEAKEFQKVSKNSY